jgi:methionine-rich copper-binding protein CopC
MNRSSVAGPVRLAGAALVAGAALGAGVAYGHAEVTSTSPKAGATVSPSLSKVSVRFGSPITTGTITVAGPKGTVSRGRGGPDPRSTARLIVRLRTPLASGRYRASWTVLAADGHRQRSSFTFKVRR